MDVIDNIYFLSDYNQRTYKQRSEYNWFERIEFIIKTWCHTYYIELSHLKYEKSKDLLINIAGNRKGIIGFKISNLKSRIEKKKILMENFNYEGNFSKYRNLLGQTYEMKKALRIYENEYRILNMWITIGRLMKGDKNANLLV